MADQLDLSTGAMLALYPDEETAAALAVDGGQPVEDLHVTVAYLGKAADINPGAMYAAAAAVIRNRPPIEARISGHARFTGGDEGDVAVALVDSPELEQLRRDLVDALRAEGIAPVSNHGYTAHLTQAYIPPDARAPVDRIEPMPITFAMLSVVHGPNRTDLPFVGLRPRSVAELAREAYAQGWAASGGPMTDRVRAGCVAAIQFAEQHADDPGVLEATLHLGHLEGVWAHVYERRDELHARNLQAVLGLLRPLLADLDVDTLVRRIRHAGAGLRESVTEASIAGLVDLILDWLRQMLHTAGWRDLRKAVAAAIVSAQAEGQVDAIALDAERYQLSIDFGLAFEDAYKALDDLPGLMDEADAWLTRIIGDEASELGTTLGRMAREDASYEEMLAAAEDLLDGDSRAVSVAIDELTARSLSAGALDLYASEGVSKVDFLTAGDARVCKVCSDLEARNPYTVASAPRPSIHPFCRCTVAAVTPLSRDLINKYAT